MSDLLLTSTQTNVYYSDEKEQVVFRKQRDVSNDRKSYDYVYVDKKNIQTLINYLNYILDERIYPENNNTIGNILEELAKEWETLDDTEKVEISEQFGECENSKMILREENKDLFTVPQGYYLAHCISSDFALGAGIAKQFVDSYNMKEKLLYRYAIDYHRGDALLIDNVFNLVTKNKCYEKPTYEELENTLYDMKDQIEDLMITKLAIPRIGCGLDRLQWDIVKEIIHKVFNDMEIEILVCTYE